MPSRKFLAKSLAVVIALSAGQISTTDQPVIIEEEGRITLVNEADLPKVKKNVVSTSQMTTGHTPAYYINAIGNKFYAELHNPARDTNSLLEIKSDLTVRSYRWWNYCSMKKFVKFFEYGTLLGDKVAGPILRGLRLKDSIPYAGTVIADEYLKGVPMQWSFATVEEFRKIKNHMTSKVKAGSTPTTILILEIADDSKLKSLNDNDRQFLNKYFIIPTGEDYFTASKFFAESKNYMRETTSRVEAAKPELAFTNLRDHVTYFIEKKLGYEFNHLKYGPKLMEKLAWIGLIAVGGALGAELREQLHAVWDKVKPAAKDADTAKSAS